jgi:hypothetical protein
MFHKFPKNDFCVMKNSFLGNLCNIDHTHKRKISLKGNFKIKILKIQNFEISKISNFYTIKGKFLNF